MAKWNIKPKHFMIAMIVSFIIAAIIFSGVILKMMLSADLFLVLSG